jgi:acetyltransferase-like isoleucine patch superfamily enzyme
MRCTAADAALARKRGAQLVAAGAAWHHRRMPFERLELHVRSPEARKLFARVPVAVALTEKLNRIAYADPAAIRALWSELTGQAVDSSFILIPPFYTEHGLNIRVGKNVFINQTCTLMDMGGIELGDETMLGPGVKLITGGHGLAPSKRKAYLTIAPIQIGRNVWLGAGASVLQGVSVGDNSVIAAGAVVTKDVPANVLVAGVPARVLRPLEDEE